MKTILVLEDSDERITAFQKVVVALGADFEVKIWRDAPSMIAECEEFFPTTALIALDHDLNTMPGATVGPGTGVDIARFPGDFTPVCPVLIHSPNTDRVYSRHNELRFAGGMVDRVGPLGTDWKMEVRLPTKNQAKQSHKHDCIELALILATEAENLCDRAPSLGD